MSRVAALVAARDEADRIAETVAALRAIPAVDEVVVIDDGSRDPTAAEALAAGATVLRLQRPRGKGGALEGALARLSGADVWLFADGDLGGTAAALARVLEPVAAGEADLAIAMFPPARSGGFGFVKRFAGAAIRLLCGYRPAEPLSGQRALTAEALAAARPLARGFGVEAAMTVDVVRAGLRVVEVPAALEHRATSKDIPGFRHRGKQGFDIVLAALPRAIGLR